MGMRTNYPSGFSTGITVRGLPLSVSHPGEVFWVNNSTVLAKGGVSGSDSNPGTYHKPFRTIDYAIGRCVGDRGDIIMVMPGHAENLATAAVIAADVAGIAIVGLGLGAKVPTLSWTALAGTLSVSAANISFVNMKFVANFADVTTMFDVTGAGDGLSFENCLFTDTDSTHNFLDCITLATGADDISFINCRGIGLSASNDSFLTGVAHDRFFMENCQWQLNIAQTSVVGLFETSGNATNVWIKNCMFRSNVDGALFIDCNGAANSGAISECYFSSIDTADAVTAGIDFTGGHVFECYVAGEADSFGLVGGGTVYANG